MLALQSELSFLLMSYVIGIVRVLVLLSIINNERLLTTQCRAVGMGRQEGGGVIATPLAVQ